MNGIEWQPHKNYTKAMATLVAVFITVSSIALAEEPAGTVAAVESVLNQRKIDLPRYREPNPTLTLANGVIIPGGGWFYLAEAKKSEMDFAKGFAFFAATAGLVLVAANGVRHNQSDQTFAGLLGIVGIRLFDLNSSVREALRRQCQLSPNNCSAD